MGQVKIEAQVGVEALDQVATKVKVANDFRVQSLSPLGKYSNSKVGIKFRCFHSLNYFSLGYLFALKERLSFRYRNVVH